MKEGNERSERRMERVKESVNKRERGEGVRREHQWERIEEGGSIR